MNRLILAAVAALCLTTTAYAQPETVEQMCARESSMEHKTFGAKCVEKVNELNAQGKTYAEAHPKPKELTDDERHHMTDLERSRDPLYGLTSNEFSGCKQVTMALYGLPMDSNGNLYSDDGWTPFECYKIQWRVRRDVKACYASAVNIYRDKYATDNMPVDVQRDLQSGCAMWMGASK